MYFWSEIDKAIVACGFPALKDKFKLPFWFLYPLALVAEFVGFLLQTTFKLNLFNVFVLTMNRWFDITAAETDLKFTPIIPYNKGWEDTIQWFKQFWLVDYMKDKKYKSGILGIAKQSQTKIDIQAESALSNNKKK